MKDDRLYLDHIRERIQLTEIFTANGREAFFQSRLIQEAVIRNFEVIVEATRRISEQTRHNHPDISWAKIIALRNVLIHDYDNVDLNRVWSIILQDLPVLKSQIEAIIQEIDAKIGKE